MKDHTCAVNMGLHLERPEVDYLVLDLGWSSAKNAILAIMFASQGDRAFKVVKAVDVSFISRQLLACRWKNAKLSMLAHKSYLKAAVVPESYLNTHVVPMSHQCPKASSNFATAAATQIMATGTVHAYFCLPRRLAHLECQSST